MKKYIVGLTGASGSILFKETIILLSNIDDTFIYVVATNNGKDVFEYELEENFNDFISSFENISLENIDNMFSTIASGSSDIDAMIITPCSMGTIGNIANCTSNNLLIRASDVMIKEQKPLVLGIRESPLSKLHLDNLSKLSITNVFITPCVPSYYNKPKNLEDLNKQIVKRQISYLGIDLEDNLKWGKND